MGPRAGAVVGATEEIESTESKSALTKPELRISSPAGPVLSIRLFAMCSSLCTTTGSVASVAKPSPPWALISFPHERCSDGGVTSVEFCVFVSSWHVWTVGFGLSWTVIESSTHVCAHSCRHVNFDFHLISTCSSFHHVVSLIVCRSHRHARVRRWHRHRAATRRTASCRTRGM